MNQLACPRINAQLFPVDGDGEIADDHVDQ